MKRRGPNEGSLYRRESGAWRAQVYLSGKRISRGFKTRSEAQVWLRSVLAGIDHGFQIGSTMTLSEYLPSWLENHRVTLREKTAHQYSGLIRNHILPLMGDRKLRELHLAGIESYYARLLQNGVGLRTIRIVNNILHASLEKAVRYGLIGTNPTQGASLPAYHHDEMRVLDQYEVVRFLQSARNSPNYALYHTAITTGMRLGELLGLKWSDIHFEAGLIHVQRQKQYVPGVGFLFIDPKTRAGRRTIRIGERSLQTLKDHSKIQAAQISKAGERWHDMDLVFPNSVGRPGDASNIRLDFNHVLMLAGLAKIRFHDLRHTAASLLLNHRVPAIVVSKILGHSKPSVTMDIYAHVLCDMQGEAARVMDRLIPALNY